MKAIIKQVNSYEITIGEITYKGFTKGTEWNGMVEFTNEKGRVIVANESGLFDNVFSEFLSKEGDSNGKDYRIVQASPCFFDRE